MSMLRRKARMMLAKCFQLTEREYKNGASKRMTLMATGRSAKRQEDYADVEIVSNVEEPKLDLYSCLRTVTVTRNCLTLYIIMQPSL